MKGLLPSDADARPRSETECRWLFVLSPERSGSTLLSVMLGAHSRILAPPELHLLRYRDYEAWRNSYPLALGSLQTLCEMMGLPVEEDLVDEAFRGLSTPEVYRRLLARGPAGHLLVDKTPAYARSDEPLERAESLRPRYLWLIRHPLGVAASRMERRHRKRRANRRLSARLKYPLYLLRRMARGKVGRVRAEVRYWMEAHQRIERFLGGVDPERWHTVHFEALVGHPEETLEGLSEWLGMTVEPAMLEPGHNAPSGLRWGLGDEKLLARPAIDPAAADRWREDLDESMLAPRALALMDRLNVRRSPVRGGVSGESESGA